MGELGIGQLGFIQYVDDSSQSAFMPKEEMDWYSLWKNDKGMDKVPIIGSSLTKD